MIIFLITQQILASSNSVLDSEFSRDTMAHCFLLSPMSSVSQIHKYETTSLIALSRHRRNDLWLNYVYNPYGLGSSPWVEFHSKFHKFFFQAKKKKNQLGPWVEP